MRSSWLSGVGCRSSRGGQSDHLVYRITERVARESRRKDRFRRWFSRARHLEIERTMAPPHLTPVDEFERRQSSETVYRILDRLPGKYRNVLILFELEELSGEEIAT